MCGVKAAAGDMPVHPTMATIVGNPATGLKSCVVGEYAVGQIYGAGGGGRGGVSVANPAAALKSRVVGEYAVGQG